MVIPATLLGAIWIAMICVGWGMLLRGVSVLGKYMSDDMPDMRGAKELAWGLAIFLGILVIPACVHMGAVDFYYTLSSLWLYAVVAGILLVGGVIAFWIVVVKQQIRHYAKQ